MDELKVGGLATVPAAHAFKYTRAVSSCAFIHVLDSIDMARRLRDGRYTA